MCDPAMLEARVRGHVERKTPALLGGRLVLAVSGGADSAAMAALLIEAGIASPERALLAHFDHRLRGEAASRAEGAAVSALARRYGVALSVGAWDDPRTSELAAREARYAFLRQVADRHGARAVVTGHTADDQAETVMMHAIRGGGLAGLAAMAEDAPWPLRTGPNAPRLLRPLLGVFRDETRGYCAAGGLPFVDDPTNEHDAFLRNRVRHYLLPALEAAAPGTRAALLLLAVDARARSRAHEALAAVAVVADGARIRLSRDTLLGPAPDVAAQAVRLAARQLLGDTCDIGARHIAAVRAAAARTGSELCLPRGLVAIVDYDAVVLSRGAPPVATIDPAFERALPYAGVVGQWRVEIDEVAAHGPPPCADAPNGPQILAAPAGAVVRGRRPGDRIQPRGMRGHKKLQDYYTDRKVPRRERDAAPVIAAGRDILWTPYGAAEPDAGPRLGWYAVRSTRFSPAEDALNAVLATADGSLLRPPSQPLP